MLKKLICIECPVSCELLIELSDGKVIKIEGHKCDKGQEYAKSEIENPQRIITSTVLAEKLSLKMVPIRSDKPIPKDKVLPAIEAIKEIRIKEPVALGQVIRENFLNLGVNLIATRDVS